jgi:ArsR family transcriptional regulator
MSLIEIYQCLCDRTRLRILNLLSEGPLCVCHFQEILDESQVKISKHLSYLKKRGMVEVRREANWMIYSLASKPSRELKANMACLQDCTNEDRHFRSDRDRLQKRREDFSENSPICCPPMRSKSASVRR